jgi:hypothetical protein
MPVDGVRQMPLEGSVFTRAGAIDEAKLRATVMRLMAYLGVDPDQVEFTIVPEPLGPPPRPAAPSATRAPEDEITRVAPAPTSAADAPTDDADSDADEQTDPGSDNQRR